MLSEIKRLTAAADFDYSRLLPTLWGRPRPAGGRGGTSRWAGKKWELTAISRPEPVCVVWSWHPPPLDNRKKKKKRASLHSKLFTRSGPGDPVPELSGTGGGGEGGGSRKPRRKPGGTFRPSCSCSAQFGLRVFSSSSNLTDVTGCVLPNPEVCVSGNGSAASARPAAPPAVRPRDGFEPANPFPRFLQTKTQT